MLTRITPNLMVENVEETLKFYKDILGCFDIIATDPAEKPYDWAMMQCEETQIMFQSRESLSRAVPAFKGAKIGGTFVIYIEVENLDRHYNLIKDKINLIMKLHQTDYGIDEFIIEDCNGYTIVFAQLQK